MGQHVNQTGRSKPRKTTALPFEKHPGAGGYERQAAENAGVRSGEGTKNGP